MPQCPDIIRSISTHEGHKAKPLESCDDEFLLLWSNSGMNLDGWQDLIEKDSLGLHQVVDALKSGDLFNQMLCLWCMMLVKIMLINQIRSCNIQEHLPRETE